MIAINYVFAFFGLLIATITDLKNREVPDWLNYSLLSLGFGSALISWIQTSNYQFMVFSVLGFLAATIIALIFYYAGQWGGGDAKMLMALGALLGLELGRGIPTLIILLLNIFIVGAIYGSVFSVVLALKHKKEFKKAFSELLLEKKNLFIRKIVLVIVICCLALFFIIPINLKVLILGFGAITFFVFYFYIYSKAVEKSSMEKFIPLEKLTEGDWVLETVYVNGKKICSPKSEGIEKEQILKLLELKKYHKKSMIKIKEGIPFLPSFLIAFIVTLLIGNWFLMVI
ncbi:MAG: A24 family peptidase [Nanoarchaeota archaeon]|nr:A24 family peptidase [Nanoarchaeota archaeon]MBU1854922.1 A24 family peptidase [Nanoarchaeota archaeon]